MRFLRRSSRALWCLVVLFQAASWAPIIGASKIMSALRRLEQRDRKPTAEEFELMLEYGGYSEEIRHDDVSTGSILRALEVAEEDDGWSRMLSAMRSMGVSVGDSKGGAGGAWATSGGAAKNSQTTNSWVFGHEHSSRQSSSTSRKEETPRRRRSLEELTVLTDAEERELTLHLINEDEAFGHTSMASISERLARLKKRVLTAKQNRIIDLKEHMKQYLQAKKMHERVQEEGRNKKVAEDLERENDPRRLEELSENELGKRRARRLKEDVDRADRRLKEEWGRRLEVVEDQPERHPLWNDPFAFLGEHALSGFFAVDGKGGMKKHQLSTSKLQELQAKRAMRELEEAYEVEVNSLQQLEGLWQAKMFSADKYRKLHRIQTRRLGVAQQALSYNRRLLGSNKYLTAAGIRRQLQKDPKLQRMRKKLHAGKRRVLREMEEERRRLEADERAGDAKFARYKERRRLERLQMEAEDSERADSAELVLRAELVLGGRRKTALGGDVGRGKKRESAGVAGESAVGSGGRGRGDPRLEVEREDEEDEMAGEDDPLEENDPASRKNVRVLQNNGTGTPAGNESSNATGAGGTVNATTTTTTTEEPAGTAVYAVTNSETLLLQIVP